MKRSVRVVAVAVTLGMVGCDGPPTGALEVSPREGEAPLEVVLDASGSEGASALSYRFDLDGDGELDTEPSAEPTLTHVYTEPGSYTPSVEVTDERGETVRVEADASVEVRAAPANLTVDANRDGVLDGDDELDADLWTETRGAVFFANFDDDDGDQARDFRDSEVDGPADVEDLAPVVLRHAAGAQSAKLYVEPPEASARVRLFEVRADGEYTAVHEPGVGVVDIDAGRLAEGDVTLLLEGAGSRDHAWDGRVTLRLEVTRDGGQVASDQVVLRVAPILFPDNTRPAEVLYVMRIDDRRLGENLAFYDALAANLPRGIELYTIAAEPYYADRWVQDNMQTGYQVMPAGDGEREMLTYLEAERISGYGLEDLVPYELMRADFGFAYPGGAPSSLNYGGNLEVTPPHVAGDVEYPFGRFVIGGGDQGLLNGRSHADFMSMEQKGFLDAQELQGTAVEMSTEWLAVGHLDEIILFIPDSSRPERPWRVLIASPTLAREALLELAEDGQGALPVFEGRDTETTVAEILADEELLAFNDAAQARVDSVREVLTEAMHLSDDDFIELPVLYEPLTYDGLELAVAYNPGVQNLVVTGHTLFIPDPEGPRPGGVDVWQEQIRGALEGSGNELHFVDVFESYHLLLGEAHCGTNVRHTPYEARWWHK